MIAILPPAGAQSDGAATSRAPWCTGNPAQPMQGRFVEIGENKIHIVQASRQANARQRLSNGAFVKINKQEASQLVRDSGELSAADNYYLVRASAFDLDEHYTIVSRLEASLFPEQKALQIVNTSLSHPGAIPKNFAIVVETNTEIQKVEIICLTAA